VEDPEVMTSKKDFRYNVGVQDLRKVTNILLDMLEELGYDHVELDKTYYWDIPSEQVYDPMSDPHDLELGDLHDDWQELLKTLADPERAATPFLFCLGSIYRALGDHTHH